MKIWEKIKSWFSGVTKIVMYLMEKFGEGAIMADKKANYKTWWRYIIAFLEDAYLYAEMVEDLLKKKPTAAPASVSIQQHFKREDGYTPQGGINARAFKTMYFREKADKFNIEL